MKKSLSIFLLVLVLFGSAASAAWCNPRYMSDPCPIEGYDMVQTEKFTKGRHNWMNDIHYFGEKKRVVKKSKKRVKKYKKRKVSKKRYKYIKKCRLVKVRR